MVSPDDVFQYFNESPTRAPITALFLYNDQSVGVLVQSRGHALFFLSLSGMIQIEHSTSAPNERVLRVKQACKAEFQPPIRRSHS